MPLLTGRDKQEIRTGRNKALGAMYAKRLFAADLVWTCLKWGVPLGLLAWLGISGARLASDAWSGGLRETVSDDWPLALLGLLFVGLLVSLARAGSSPRRRRRRRRR